MDQDERIPFAFVPSFDGTYTYQYVSDYKYGKPYVYGAPYILQTIVAKNWPGLFSTEVQGSPNSPSLFFNMNGGDTLEENAVYLGFVWRIAQEKELKIFGIARYYGNGAATVSGKTPDYVNWEYEAISGNLPQLIIDKGFVPARSCVFTSPTSWQTAHKHLAGLFDITFFAELVELQRATLCDATSEINLFLLKPGRKVALVQALQSSQKPELTTLLEPGEMLISIVKGVDMTYIDSVLIKSASDISAYLQELLADYDRAITSFEAQVDDIKDEETYLKVIEKLAQGKLST